MVWGDTHKLRDNYSLLCSSTMEELGMDIDSGLEEDDAKHDSSFEDSTIFVAFKGNIDDEDFKQKLGIILNNVPDLLNMESERLVLRKVEPWNSVRVTFNIPREAAERLRMLAQNNNQQLRDLGILSVQIEGEGAINLSLAQNRGQDVRINGQGSSVRMETGFPISGSQGLIRINNPASVMIQQSGNVSSSMMTSAPNTELQPRTPRPASQSDAVDPLLSGLTIQQQTHPSGSVVPQLHSVQSVSVNRQINPANFQQMQPQQHQQPRPPQQHQQPQQSARPSFTGATQVPVPPGWNQVPSGTVQPPPSQGTMGTLTVNQGWKKTPLPGQMQQQQLQARPSLATVQTPSHPPPPYPFGSQQASQAHTNFPQMNNSGQFTAPQMKNLQGGPSRVPTPLQQPHLTNKSPASSPSSFQQASPASSPTVNQAQQQMGPRPTQNNTLPQGFQQPVNSPGRNPMVQQGNVPPNFMVMQQQNQAPQGLHPGLGGIPKRLPPGFSAGQANQNFMQGQVPSTAPGTPANGGTPQLQTSQGVQHTGGQGNGLPQNQMQVQHGPSNMMQTNLIGLHGSMNNQQTSTSGVPQVNLGSMQGQTPQGPQSQLMGMHQQIVSSQGQMVNIQSQGSLNPQNQMILSRAQLMPQGQMMVAPQNQNLGPAQQRMTPPKQMIPQQGQQMMAAHNQMVGPQGQVLMQQNSMMEQMMTNQMQGNKPPFSAQSQSNVMSGPAQIMRGPTPNMQGNMVQFTGQMMTQQGPVNGSSSQVMGIQGQVLRPTGPSPHMSQQLGETTTTTNSDVNLTQMLPDVSMQQGNMVPPHLQGMQGNSSTSGNHFAGHGMPFNASFSAAQNGNQISCGQNPGFPVNKDVTLTSPLLVNLLQSDISAGHFGVNNKQSSQTANKPKKKKPPRKKKNNQQVEPINTSEARPAGLEEADQPTVPGEQSINLDNTGHKLSDFTNRPQGYPAQPVEQRSLQQMPPQLLQHGQQQQQQPPPPPPIPQQTQSQQQQQQQMMMMLMMQQDPKSVRLPIPQGVHQPRGPLNVETQRMPMQQGSNMSVMVSLQGPGAVPPSPDKQRIPMPNNPTLLNNARKMVYTDSAQNLTSSPLGEVPSLPPVSEGNGPETAPVSGPQNNIASHLIVSQNQLLMTGPKPGPSPLSAPQGASPQQQANSLPGPHPHHFQNVAPTSQTSRPKTPNRASPRPYYPQTPNNRPPSTEPSEISLSPERLNASIAGLFPPQINIPLPPRPSLNRGFDQQGLNPTTLKAIGQAPSNLTMNSQSNFVSPQTHKLDPITVNSGKQTNTGGAKRASPSSSRRSSPGSSRKTTPSPGRQNSKAAKLSLTSQQNPALMQNMDLQRSMMVGPPSLQTSMPGNFQNNGMLTAQNTTIPISVMTGIPEDNKESFTVPQESTCQNVQVIQVNKDQHNMELKGVPSQEIKILVHEDQQKREPPATESTKLPSLEESKTILSPAMREAPTSLSQLLDNSGAPNVTIKPPGLPGLEVPPTVTCASEFKKVSSIPPQQDPPSSKDPTCSLTLPPHTEACSAQVQQDLGDINPSVSQNMSPVIQRPVSTASISTSLPPNQITVFVTSNPITSSSNTPASLPSHLQSTLMPTVVTMPNVGNKVMTSEGQTAVQSNTRPQFITPVFINSSSIIQVMKGSQPSTMPTTPMTSNSNLIPQSVAVVGPLHLPQNIKFSSGPVPPSSSSNTISSMATSRSLVINSLPTPVPLSSSSTVPSSTSLHPPNQQVKDFNPEEVSSQGCTSVDPCAEATSQSGVVVSPTHPHSPGSSVNRRSPVSSAKGKGKLDRIGHFLLTKACKKVTDSFEKGEEQYAMEEEVEGQGQDVSLSNSLEVEQLPVELEDNIVPSPEPTLLKQSTSGSGLLNTSSTATVSASVSLNLPDSTPSTNVLSVVTTPVICDIVSPIPSTNGNPGNFSVEQVGTGLEDEKTEAHHELPQNMASSGQTPVGTPEHTVQRTELEGNSAVTTGLVNEPKESCEKSKTPSRRNSRTEESAVVQETIENGQRKRSSRPASASSMAKETNSSAMQSKRRKSK